MMKDRQLLETFLKDNFNIEFFKIYWLGDYCVRLTDVNNSSINLTTIGHPEMVQTYLNGEEYLAYIRVYHRPSNSWVWQVLSLNK